MLKEHNNTFRKIQLAIDLCVTAFSFFLAYEFRVHSQISTLPINPISHYLFMLYMIIPLWGILLHYHKAYESVRFQQLSAYIVPVAKTVLSGCLILTAILFTFNVHSISRVLLVSFFLIDLSLLAMCRTVVFFLFKNIRERGYNYRTILVVGPEDRSKDFVRVALENSRWGIRIAGFVSNDRASIGKKLFGKEVIGTIEDVPGIITKLQVDELVFLGPMNWHSHLEKVVHVCETVGIRVRILFDFYPTRLSRMGLDNVAGLPFLILSPPPNYGDRFVFKRIFDIAVSLLAVLALSPLMLVIALAIKLESSGPVFFRQDRYGLNRRVFKLIKFRTMYQDSEKRKKDIEHLNEMSGPVFKIKNDPRITRVGRILRKYSLDELPQFFNVLKGEMSIVGPRPPIRSEVEKYDIWHNRRLSVRPGITCLWQVNGRNSIEFSEWMKLDLEYIDNWSLSLDMKIVLKTVPAVLRGTGF